MVKSASKSYCILSVFLKLSNSMSVEQFSELESAESMEVIVIFTSLSLRRSNGSQHGVIGVIGTSGNAGVFAFKFPLLTSSMAFLS